MSRLLNLPRLWGLTAVGCACAHMKQMGTKRGRCPHSLLTDC